MSKESSAVNNNHFEEVKEKAVRLAPTFMDYVRKVNFLHFLGLWIMFEKWISGFSISRIESNLQY